VTFRLTEESKNGQVRNSQCHARRVFGFPHSVRLTASAKVTGIVRAPKEHGFGLFESLKSGDAGEAGTSLAFCARTDALMIVRLSRIENDRRSILFFPV